MEAVATKESGGREWSPAIPARHIAGVIAKLNSGEYPTEETRCPCGADANDTELCTKDRYFIPHRMVMCNECALIRANPRMTEKAYAEFYNREYRPIYDGWQFGQLSEDNDFRFMAQADRGVDFKAFLEYFDLKPKTIIDIGSNTGGMVQPFKEVGARVYGVEIEDRGRSYARAHGVGTFRSVEEAANLGIKADLIILQDVVEHLLDFSYIDKLRSVLAPDGVIYIGTPGLFHSRLDIVWQNAHVWQFVAETLTYIMSSLGFEALFCDENIDSIWKYVGEEATGMPKPGDWREYIAEHLEGREKRKLPPVRCVNKFPVSLRWENMDKNLSYGFPDMGALIQKYSGQIAILGGGPSINGQLDKIRALVDGGAKTIAIERMYPWCKQVGIKPDFVTCLDASDDIVEGFAEPQPDTTHILTNMVNPAASELLKNYKTYIYGSIMPGLKVQNLWAKHGYEKVTVINTGGSVVLSAFSLAAAMGFRNVHFFGFDCMVTPDATYAEGIAGESVPREYFPAEIGGKTYVTCFAFISFARQFFQMANDARKFGLIDSIDIHGDSLVNVMWDRARGACPIPSQGAC